MKTIMCFGDSITWGQDPVTRQRLNFAERWPGVVQGILGSRGRVIEEALCDRSTVWDDPYVEGRNGMAMLATLLESHAPVDLLIIMLGTNDFQRHLNKSADDVALGCGALINLAQSSRSGPAGDRPAVLAIAPPALGNLNAFAKLYFAGKEEQSRLLAERLRIVTQTSRCHWMDASSVVSSSETDGVHLDRADHAQLGAAIAQRCVDILALSAV